jgi:serine/threonine-protein kinase
MTKHPDPRWEEGSAPEISVSAIIEAHADDLRNINVVGERFGKYLLVGEIAMGGMAELFLAVHKGLEGFIKVVVIKRVLPQFSSHGEFVRMFIDEARLAARLEHPNIVRTYEFGEVNGQYFTAMEYLPGEDLHKALNNLQISKQLMPINIAAGIASQVCTGLHFAHHFTDIEGVPLNLVHRDINPANIVLTYGGEVKIVDFGVAKSDAHPKTVTGTIKGKVAYMPPEQVLGRNVDQRSDIFSAGVVLWEMLTGRPLFLRDNEAATLYAIMNAPIPPPSRLRPDVPVQLDRIVARALARSPADRYAAAEDMVAALDEALLQMPRYDVRALARMVEALFGPTRADAKRGIAQTRSLTRNISLVMRLRSEVRADLAERLDAAVTSPDDIETVPHRQVDPDELTPARGVAIAEPSRSQRWLTLTLAIIMLFCIGAGLAYTTSRSAHEPAARPAVQTALEVDSTPRGAAVFVGGEPTGRTTPTTLTGLTAQQLVLRLELANHAAAAETIDLVPGTTVSKHFTLPALPSRLVISELPPSASVFIDGDEHQAGEVMSITPGRHLVRVVVDGRTLAEQAIEASAGDQGWRLAHGKLVPK